jgi:Nif-specific regulatory protein
MVADVHDGNGDRVRRERDLYRQLLDLGHEREIEPFLKKALALIVEVVGARRGYLELRDEGSGGEAALFWEAGGCTDDDVAEIREAFSRGVIAEAIATGKTISTASALLDPRFKARGSVRRNRIEAVLCTPIGTTPPIGVVYLQDRIASGPFSEEDQTTAGIFARHIAVLADRLLVLRRRREERDATIPYRRALRAERLIGRSRALASVLRQVAEAAPNNLGVLLTGPNGTGKTQIARIIHDSGPRASGPFVELNCATLAEPLFENELFGAVQGAHATASRKVDGKVTAADGGTLFLDEVGEIPLTAQAKLLKLLESKEYYPLGASRPSRADVRIIAATNADLEAAVERRAFRQDLFYRLEELPIRVPALSERREDIAELVVHFCEATCEAQKLPRVTPSAGALFAAEAAEWPGNIRQLANAVRRAVIRAAGDGLSQIERRHLFPDDEGRRATPDGNRPSSPDGDAPLTFQEATRRFQSDLLRRTLEDTNWNVTETAERLDLTRSHVYNLIKAFGLGRRKA